MDNKALSKIADADEMLYHADLLKFCHWLCR